VLTLTKLDSERVKKVDTIESQSSGITREGTLLESVEQILVIELRLRFAFSPAIRTIQSLSYFFVPSLFHSTPNILQTNNNNAARIVFVLKTVI
jgi:hypothetical protein